MLFLHWHYSYLINLFYFSCKKGGGDNRGVIYKPGIYKEKEDISKIWCPALSQQPLFIHCTDLFWISETHHFSWLMITFKRVLKTHISLKFSVGLVVLFSREIWSVNSPELNSSPHSFMSAAYWVWVFYLILQLILNCSFMVCLAQVFP